MADALGGFAQGLAKGLDTVNRTVDTLEAMRQNRENMRLKLQQEARQQESHDVNMQMMAQKLEALEAENFKRDFLDEAEALYNGWTNGFSSKITSNPRYQSMFQNYNVRPASYYGKDILAQQGIGEEEAGDWYIGSDDQGSFMKVRKDIFNQTTGLQSRFNKRNVEDAETLTKQTKAMTDSMIQQNIEELTPIYDQAKATLEAKIADPNTDPEELVRLYGALTQLAQYKAGYGMLSGGKGGNIPFAIQESENLKNIYKPFESLDYKDEDRLAAEAYGAKYGKNFYSGISNVMGNTITQDLTSQGIQVGPAMDLSKLSPELQRAINDRAKYASKSALGEKMIKDMNELMGNESLNYGMQIAQMAASGKNFKRDAVYKATDSLLRKMPDGVFGDWKNERMTDDEFNVLAQLYINAYGNEKFGSALTETEAGKIDAVFGSGWDNTQKFLKGLKSTMLASYEKMLANCKYDPLLAAQLYGSTFIGMQNAIRNIDEYEKGLSKYAAWVQRQKTAGKKDLTYATYEKQLNSMPNPAGSAQQMQPLNPGQSTQPQDDEYNRAMKALEGANLFGGSK